MEDYKTITLIEECNAVIQNKLPLKLKDPGSFSIPCTIGEINFDKVLCDLGASINLIPFSVFRKLGLKEPTPTTISLQLADRSIRYPRGVVEDVLIKVDKFIFPIDFIVLDMEEDYDMPLILERPFLTTGRTLIDVQQGTLSLRIYDEIVTFNVFKSTKYFNDNEREVLRIDGIGDLVKRFDEPIENYIANSFDDQKTILDAKNKVMAKGYLREKQKSCPSKRDKLLPLDVSSSSSKAKPPSHEKKKMIRVLKELKKGIGWKVANIQGISPSSDMHKILTEEGFKPP
ncbi:uncharacterized protein LOC127791583 [Diospyros lotus]|uniref:uncharacterized protein LOC127791583 n=1 Tax=Diospyros lotus TaxID=55363 RepID=UPI00224D5FFB|nr:uncharacterized protein LOC127791583 [Diospyros lotus]